MIATGLFNAQLETIEVILKSSKLWDERQRFPNKDLGAADFKGLSYRLQYEVMIREFAYDFRLTDQSLLLFVKGGTNKLNGSLSYSFVEPPFKVKTYEEFVLDEFAEIDEDTERTLSEMGDSFRVDYEQYVTTSAHKAAVTPVRYDYQARDYRTGVHPASHVHFGFESNIRIGTRRILTPISFCLMIIRQFYPHQWTSIFGHAEFENWCRQVRESLEEVDAAYWHPGDLSEMYLH